MKQVLLILLFLSVQAFSQSREYSGIVVDKSDQSPIPGVEVSYGDSSQAGTLTDFDGKFTIKVPDSVKVLTFRFLGYKEFHYKPGKEKFITIQLKEECTICQLDARKTGANLVSGILNTPVGGEFYISFPVKYTGLVFETGMGYQTDLKDNTWLNAHFDLKYLISNCDFRTDIHTTYKQLKYDNYTEAETYSIESLWDLHSIKLYAGYAHINFANPDKRIDSGGLVLGAQKRFYKRYFRFYLTGKTAIYKDLNEFELKFEAQYRRWYSFVKFYNLDNFNEITLGVGYHFYYRLHKRKH